MNSSENNQDENNQDENNQDESKQEPDEQESEEQEPEEQEPDEQEPDEQEPDEQESEEQEPDEQEPEEQEPEEQEPEEQEPDANDVSSKTIKINKNKIKRRKQQLNIYHSSMLTKKISVPISNIGENLRETLDNIIKSEYEGKCIAEGYVKYNSTKILTYSSGLIHGDTIVFDIVFECMVCLPVEGMYIDCVVQNITRAGIRAGTGEKPSPVVIFIARDHHTNSKNFAKIVENENIKVKVIGQRYELNDTYISIIAELVNFTTKKPKIKINLNSI
mgnify:FL=1